MREIHGVVARKGDSALDPDDQAVRIVDNKDGVQLVLSCNAREPALLTTDEARFIARMLVEAANRVDTIEAVVE